MLAVGGCGGTGNGSPPVSTRAPVPAVTAATTLIVTVTDLLGSPVAGAEVQVSGTRMPARNAITDVVGRAEFPGVVDGELHVSSKTADLYGYAQIPSMNGAAVFRQPLLVRSIYTAPGGIAGATVNSVADDGRSLEYTLSILRIPDPRFGESQDLRPEDARVMACTPDLTNDAQRFQPDCVSGNDGFDAGYDGFDSGRALSIARIPGPGYDAIFRPTFSSTLLLDQSAAASAADPADARLFAAKYFLTWSHVEHVVGLAAFAADDASSGRIALLPQKPVTIFPVESPGLTTTGRNLFSTVDALATLEGGVAPLYAALDRTIDFAAARPDEVSAIVVVTDGRDPTCGSRSECRARREALLQKSRDKKVAITTIGLASSAAAVDREALGELSRGSGGHSKAAFWTTDPRELSGSVAVALSHQQIQTGTTNARFRIQSSAPGTFVSGHTVIGWVRLHECYEFACSDRDISYTIKIP